MDATHSAVDYRPLGEIVTPQQIREFKARARASGTRFSFSADKAGVIGMAAVVIVVGFGQAASLASATATGFPPAGILSVVFVVLLLAVAGFVAYRAMVKFGGRWEKWMRLTRFAEANGMNYRPSTPNPWYPGTIFAHGSSRSAYDSITRTDGRLLDIGNYRYTTGSGKNRTTHDWGYMVLALDRALPHMVLDSRANNGLFGSTNLPKSFQKDQVLSLEGDFNEYFTLYCPRQYERDALYVFTPDLMALLIDEAAPFDVEIVDEWMFVYSSKPFDPLSRTNYERLFRIVRTVGAKTLTQTDRYRDERVPSFEANIVAPAGKRLKTGVSVGAVVVFVAFALFWLWSTVGNGLVG